MTRGVVLAVAVSVVLAYLMALNEVPRKKQRVTMLHFIYQNLAENKNIKSF